MYDGYPTAERSIRRIETPTLKWPSQSCGCGGTGRRAAFRSPWGQPRGGSSPLSRTYLLACDPPRRGVFVLPRRPDVVLRAVVVAAALVRPFEVARALRRAELRLVER